MEKITLTLGEVLDLESEINGLINNETGEIVYEGFRKQKLNILLKYDINDFGDKLKNEVKLINVIRDELIKKYGRKTDNDFFIDMFDIVKDDKDNIISKTVSKNYIDFQTELGSLLESKTKEFEVPEITKDDLKNAGETKDDYRVLFKIIKK